MRVAQTPSEEALWSALCSAQLGVTFRRQYLIGRFIADFAAPSTKAVIEVDGGYHSRRTSADTSRDAKLPRLGWRVLRLPTELVTSDLSAAVAAVREALFKM
jgi:very-short-patch-repair endonuclease